MLIELDMTSKKRVRWSIREPVLVISIWLGLLVVILLWRPEMCTTPRKFHPSFRTLQFTQQHEHCQKEINLHQHSNTPASVTDGSRPTPGTEIVRPAQKNQLPVATRWILGVRDLLNKLHWRLNPSGLFQAWNLQLRFQNGGHSEGEYGVSNMEKYLIREPQTRLASPFQRPPPRTSDASIEFQQDLKPIEEGPYAAFKRLRGSLPQHTKSTQMDAMIDPSVPIGFPPPPSNPLAYIRVKGCPPHTKPPQLDTMVDRSIPSGYPPPPTTPQLDATEDLSVPTGYPPPPRTPQTDITLARLPPMGIPPSPTTPLASKHVRGCPPYAKTPQIDITIAHLPPMGIPPSPTTQQVHANM